jgi:hypothetical protein
MIRSVRTRSSKGLWFNLRYPRKETRWPTATISATMEPLDKMGHPNIVQRQVSLTTIPPKINMVENVLHKGGDHDLPFNSLIAAQEGNHM